MHRAWLVVVSIGIAVSAGAGEAPLTLEAIFGGDQLEAALPEAVHWIPDGSAFLYRQSENGRTALYRQEAATGQRQGIVDWETVMAQLRAARPGWTKPPVGDVEQSSHARLEPTLAPDGSAWVGLEAGDLFRLDLATGRAAFLTEGPAPELWPQFSPDGRFLAWVREGSLWVRELAGAGERRLTDHANDPAVRDGAPDWVYEEELGVVRSYWWSPDGSRILFVRTDTSPLGVYPISLDQTPYAAVERQPYATAGTPNARVRLGVVPRDGGEPVFVDSGTADGYLPRAGWAPDGARIWYEWLSRDQRTLELRLADPATGRTVATVLREEDLAWVNLTDGPLWVAPDRFLWRTERGGWWHLVLYHLDGRVERSLAEGPWEITDVYGLDAEKRSVIAQGNPGDPRERHLLAVPLDGGAVEPLESEPGVHEAELAPGGRFMLDTCSDLGSPTRIVLRGTGPAEKRAVRVVADGAIPALAGYLRSPVQLGKLQADDGTVLYTETVLPPVLEPGRRYPAVLYVYGGPHSQLVQNQWDGSRRLFFEFLAQRGFVVLWLDNRGTAGRGRDFERAVDRRLGAVELADQLVGARHLAALPYVDPTRIAVYGGSYGGFMALTCLTRAPDVFAAGIAYAPVTDWSLYDSAYTERYMGTPADNPEGYRESSILEHADALAVPVLLAQGAMDNNVHTVNTLRLVDRLAAADKEFELMFYPRVRHPVRTSRFKLHFHRLQTEFLLRHLGGKGTDPLAVSYFGGPTERVLLRSIDCSAR